MLKLNHVKKRYDTFSLDCSLEVAAGRITALIGQNGAGKSTTFKALLNLTAIDDGEIEIFGKKHTDLTAKDKEKIGVSLADSGFSEYLSIKDVAAIMDRLYADFDKKKFLKQCEHFMLPLNKKIKEFSTGMRAKLKLLAAMSHGAKLLVLDEPTAGLDVVAREELLGMLQAYMEKQEDASVLISSHISGDLEKFCDDVYMIDDGKIVLYEETDELLGSYGLLKVEEKQYDILEKKYLMRRRKESFGYSVLTNNRQFYLENNPGITVEKIGIDDVILMMTRGEVL